MTDVKKIESLVRENHYFEQQLRIATELIEMYIMEIRNCPEIKDGFCQGSLFKDRLSELEIDIEELYHETLQAYKTKHGL